MGSMIQSQAKRVVDAFDGDDLSGLSPDQAAAIQGARQAHAEFEVVDRETYLRMVREEYAEEGILEVDPEAVVSISENGAYVQVWVYVENEMA